MNRWRRTLAKRRKKQREAQPGTILMFKGRTAAVGGLWKPGCSRPKPPPLEEQGVPTVTTVLEDCKRPLCTLPAEEQLAELLKDLDL